MKEDIVEVLFTKGMRILLSLLDSPLRFTDLTTKTKFSSATLSRCLEKTRKLGLTKLNFDETKSYGERLTYGLTEKGQKLAELGKKIVEEA
jgi:DNA-binding HxlR family transcriptional regulator